MMMNTALIAIGEGGVQPVSQLIIDCNREDKETTNDDDEQPRRWASDDDDDLIWFDDDELKRDWERKCLLRL